MIRERAMAADRRDLEDMSTLGMDWDNETIETNVVTNAENASVATGDIDEDDLEADQRRYLEEHAIVVDGYKCPDEFINIITPMEFEEMVNLFTKFDVDHSNTIDKHETKKILIYLGMDASMEMAIELLDIVDVDKSGEIDFEEFCNFIVMLKRGDPRLQGYGAMLSVLNSTPLGELERQCVTRGLKIKFVIKEKREATLTNPTQWIVEVQLSGVFHNLENGEVVATQLTKRFQGMGATTKEAKYNAASNAIINLGESMPGVRCKAGEFPEEWMEWLNDNLLRGVEAGKIVSILASKGFYPHRNPTVMHRILAWSSFDRFMASHPEIDMSDPAAKLHEDFFEWIKETAKRGIDGEVLAKVLEDRCIDLKKDHLHFAQKLENNELGSLMDLNGQTPDILDFWHACKCGYLDDVLIYCKCGVQVNEERVDRHTTERTTPLIYAAAGGHDAVVKVLLTYGADPKMVDLRGRGAVHHAALKGHTACCAHLIDGGAMMFAGDIQQNTPLHLAAMNNHYDCVNFLAFKALDVTRMMTSDKIKVRKDKNFLQLAEEVFNELPGLKLTSSDTVRVEKTWLNEAANIFISKMDKDVIHMLASSSAEIMEDVLARFDPRPESGIFLTGGINGEQIFLKTIANPADLAVLLKHTFRQSALDTINSWKRTPLHMACDANHINSHEKLILRMIDFHGCTVSMRDMHGRRPIDLLIKDKILQNMPTSTQIREELLIDLRTQRLEEMFAKFDAEDAERTRLRRQHVLDECIEQDGKMTLRLWHCLREGAFFKKNFAKSYDMYEDPDTGNYFYCKIPHNIMMGDTYDSYSWCEPASIKALLDRTNALFFLLRIRSTFLRRFEEWEVYRCNKTNIDYFYNINHQEINFGTPKHLTWRNILKEATNTKQRLGYGNEWEVLVDKYQNTFYRNTHTRQCEYDRPVDAVEVVPAEMLCSAYQYKGKPTVQNWYSCEQCNRAWKTSTEGSAMTVKICEPCVVRCHSGHKGVRLIRNSQALCICTHVCRVTGAQCNALVISASQTKVQNRAIAVREEVARHRKRNLDAPPVFAMVPRYYMDGTLKAESGWMICRLCTVPEKKSKFDNPDDGELMVGRHGDDASLEEAVLSDSESSMMSMSNASLGSVESLERIERTADDAGEEKAPQRKQRQIEDNASTGSHSESASGSISERSGGNYIVALAAAGMSMKLGLPPGWIEVYDVEEPAELKYEDRVLVTRYASDLRKYATVKKEVKKGFFLVKYDDRTVADETIERSYMELVSRKRFYFNPTTGQSSWSSFQAQSNPIESQSLTLTGVGWLQFFNKSVFRRSFDVWHEMINPYIDQVFYVHTDNFAVEKAILHMQSVFRSKMRKPRPFKEWTSVSFTFDVPEAVQTLMKEKGGWAYLRRRSTNVGEFQDIDGAEWEEYTDKKTSEYFYWMEEANAYQWEKPEVYKRKLDVRELLKEGEDVMYVFPGRRIEEMAVITKVRFDDETGEDMYDLVHKYVPELAYKWVPRMQIKFVPKEGDALMLAKLEVKWKALLRRKRDADERKAKRDKELAMAAEARRLEEMKTMAYRMGKREESMLNTNTRIMRGRMKRIELEELEVREEHDRTAGKDRRDRIQQMMTDMQKGKNLTRSEVLSLTRAFELKMKIEDKVRARNELRKELIAKKKESQERTVFIEETLRDSEIRTTTPRSLVRRRIVRRMHIAMQRQANNFMICEWGCGDWFRVGKEQVDHQLRRCVRRIIGCTLGCPMKHTEEFWLSPHATSTHRRDDNNPLADLAQGSTSSHTNTIDSDAEIFYGGSIAERARTPAAADEHTVGLVTQQQYHETEECPKRLMMCPRQCLEWVCAELLDQHLTDQCTKRPAKPIPCRLGCGCKFGGQVETLIQAEDERLQHENEECNLRIVRCTWQFEDGRICAAQMCAIEREEHRDYHLTLQGMMTYTVPGTYLYKVPKKLTRLKVQLWGGGGGSGYFRDRQGGSGGGGAFVEAIIEVEPFSVLELVVGAGGGAGVNGTELETVDIHEQRRRMAIRRDIEIHLPKGEKMVHRDDDDHAVALLNEEVCGVTLGGAPGGGDGYGGAGCWAGGGGGGYSIISKRTAKGNQALLVAAGGGGGASLDGLPGAALEGVLAGTLLDPMNGTTATVDAPGKGGESGSTYNSAWPAEDGEMWRGGNGCEFGAGGGGGYFGGGGGGTMPGIAGGGGGGSSYVYVNVAYDRVIVMGHGNQPGGLNHNPPLACGVGEWDKTGGFSGQGGIGDPYQTVPGNNGAIRIIKPGHY